ncbi:hypothetical protein LACR_2325 [Lactococcus cremoris subsp. cremoris SK11]|uniref:Uncharacterized protein n=1 Tax=Lactococcus lactis subsp. cremoris (strain SK11) TaxID=272622 RepID=Q02W93_LACLS|nr:hypothetical protein LACR_2325 [Lactococcus cremoris subsp. cremoris SK11]
MKLLLKNYLAKLQQTYNKIKKALTVLLVLFY